VTHLCRSALLIGLAACAGGSTAPVGPVPAEAQTATPPPSNSKVKMPPAASLNLLGIAGQVVGVLPSTLVIARDSLAGVAPFTDRASSLKWMDQVFGEGLMMRGPEVNWKLPAQMRSIARRAPGIAADPDYMGQAVLRNPDIDKVPDPLISNLRTLMGIAGGRFVLVPAAVSFQHDSAGAVEVRMNLAGVDTRLGDVVFRSYIVASGATPEGAMDAMFAILLPGVSFEP